MKINSSDQYESEDKEIPLFDCKMEEKFKLSSVGEYFIVESKESSMMYMTHRNTVTTPGLAQDLHSCEYDAELNLTGQKRDESESARRYNQRRAKMTNDVFCKIVCSLSWDVGVVQQRRHAHHNFRK